MKKIATWFTSNWFNPHKSFISLPAFWIPLTIITSISLYVYWAIYTQSNLELCWTELCVNRWARTFQVPLGVMALLIPVLGLLNANHKSEQAKAQMEMSRSQNNFVNYYKHLDEFEKYGKGLNQKNWYVDLRRMHKKLYPEAEEGKFIISENIVTSAYRFLRRCIVEARLYASASTFSQAEENIIFRIKDFLNGYNDCLIYRDKQSGEAKVIESFNGEKNYLRALQEALAIVEIVHNLCCFDSKYNRELKNIIEIINRFLSSHKGFFGDGKLKTIDVEKGLSSYGYKF